MTGMAAQGGGDGGDMPRWPDVTASSCLSVG
jgi:hypothetical protein